MRFGILGPLAVWTADGAPVRVPGRKVRALLADLLLHEGRPVPADRLIEDLWNGRRLPVDAPAALSAKVSQLRRVLEDAEAGARRLVVSGPAGYALQPAMGAVDVQRFRTLVGEAHRAEPSRAAALLAEALGLWRGAPLADLADAPFVGAVIARLVEQRLTAQEDHAELRLDLGQHAALVDDLGALVDEHPLRERLRATYLLALYRTGRQREALDSYRLLRARLADELGLDPSPELTALHHAILVRDPALDLRVGPRRASRGRAGNLPSPTTELIGREAAVDELRHRLNANRLITLTGPGGVGKTRLAVAVAAAATARFADGAWLVELAPIERARPGRPAPDLLGRLAEAVLTVLDVKDTAGVGHATGPVDRLRRALRSRELLLVLDNCEHVVAHAAELTALTLEAAPGLRVLATSREPLGLAGEVVWGVPPLATPDHGTDVATLQQFGAVQLFVARAKAAATGFTLRSDTAAAVAEVCRRLDGIPLALELAATKVRALGVAGLAARLDDRFRLLAAGRRGGPARQHTLRAVIEWSWELLGEPERIVLRRLAVHAGGATADAAQAVCAGADLPASDVVPVLIGLVDRSLVDVVDAGGEPRYRLLESVAAYSMERLREAGELERLRTRHADHYLRLVEQAQSEIRGPEQQRWLRRLDAEAANLRVALADARPELRLRLVIGLAWYWVLRGRLTEARRSIEAALAGAEGTPAGLRAAAAAWHAGIVLRLGDIEGWEERRPRVLELVERIPDPVARARAHWFLGHCSIDYGDLEASAELLDRALTSCRTHADRWGEAAALASRCKLAHIHADQAELERDGDRAAQLFARLGDRWGLVQANGWLGALAEMVGDHERARRLCRDGLRLAEELGLWQEACTAQAFLGWIALANRDYPLAGRHGVRALRLAGEQGYRAGQVLAAIVLGYAARKDGRLDDAERHLHDVLDWTPHAEGNPASAVHLPMTLCELGFVAELRGDPATAAKLHREAFDLSQRLAGPRISVLALEGLAGALAIERPDVAARLLGAAAAARVAVGLPPAPAERGDVDRITAAVRTALGDVAFDAAFRAGRALTPTDARSLGEGND